MSSKSETCSMSMNPNLLTILENIKTQLNNLSQRMDRIKNDRRDGDRQSSSHGEDKVPRNHDCHEDDDRYFDSRLDPQYHLDWVMSLEKYFKWYDMSEKRRIRFTAMKLVRQAGYYWSNVERLT